MRPTLSPGDFVLVDPSAFRDKLPTSGELIVAQHPYRDQVIIKRVFEVVEDGVSLRGDNPDASSDSRNFGRVRFTAIIGRVTSRIS